MSDWPPRSVDGLLGEAVNSVGSVELLLVLRAAGGRPRGVDELSAALDSPRSWTELHLDALARAGLAAHDADGRWRYAPAGRRLEVAVDQLSRAWQQDRRTVRRWVFAPRRRSRRTRTA